MRSMSAARATCSPTCRKRVRWWTPKRCSPAIPTSSSPPRPRVRGRRRSRLCWIAVQAASLEILEKAAVQPAQARAIVQAIEIEIAGAKDTLATKQDVLILRHEIAELRTELRSEMTELRTELRSEMTELRTELR